MSHCRCHVVYRNVGQLCHWHRAGQPNLMSANRLLIVSNAAKVYQAVEGESSYHRCGLPCGDVNARRRCLAYLRRIII
jgi:hypothetical protein